MPIFDRISQAIRTQLTSKLSTNKGRTIFESLARVPAVFPVRSTHQQPKLAPMQMTRTQLTSKLAPMHKIQRRQIIYHPGTEKLQDTLDPTIKKNIAKIDAQDKKDGKETHVIRDGTMSHSSEDTRRVFLPLGHDDLVAASHELQHAADFSATRNGVRPSNEVFEFRAFQAQQNTALYLKLDDQLNGMTPAQRAKTHSQVVNLKK